MRRSHRQLGQFSDPKDSPKDGLISYDLYKTLPNPLYEQVPKGRRRRHEQLPIEPPKKKRRWKKILISILIFIFVVLLGAGGWIGWKAVRNFGWHNIATIFNTTKLKGEDQGRVTILLAGYSDDDPNHGGADLTDSIMLISIDTNTHKAFTLSVPRDLYVNIPNNGYAKINEAYEDGQRENFSDSGYPTGGMGLLEEVVSQKFNIPIDYYALLDYTAFRDTVNAVGGITVNIQSPDPRGLYDPNIGPEDGGPLKLANGVQTLNGQTALNLARARGDSYYSYGFPQSDFDRTMHQRQMLIALAAKASSLSVLSNPVKVGELFDAVGKNVKTDLQLNEVRRLASIMKQIPNSAIASASLNSANVNGQTNVNLLHNYETSSGESALIPKDGVDDYSLIDTYVSQLESAN